MKTSPIEHSAGQVPLFASASRSRSRRRRVEQLSTPIQIKAGYELTTEGQRGTEFGVILEGHATVSVGGNPVGKLGPGDHYGEIALLADEASDGRRTATVTADDDMWVAAFSAQEFSAVLREFPAVASHVIRTAQHRRRANEAGTRPPDEGIMAAARPAEVGAPQEATGEGSAAMKTIVVGIGGGETALTAGRQAAELARALGAKVHFVDVVERDVQTIVGLGSDQYEFSLTDAARARVQKFVSELGFPLEHTISTVEGQPARALVSEAERVGADLIVVGSVRMQGVGRVLGSVGNDVAHHAPCNVLIVKTT